MKVALTAWGNRISPVADAARELLIADIQNGGVKARRFASFTEESLFLRAGKLADLDVKIFICGAISDFYAALVEGYGIQLIPFIRGEIEEVLEAYLVDSLSSPKFAMT